MSLNTFDKLVLEKRFWIFLSVLIMALYLFPLFSGNLHVPAYDNLDSNVVWYKILAESGKIFSPNSSIIPNMMNGIPRVSYGSEFDVLLWLYKIFSPEHAFIINEYIIHIVAFLGMYLLLKEYIVPKEKYYTCILLYTGTLYFATLPFWSGSGISIASLPLTTFILLRIKDDKESILEWIYIVLLPFYSSFILVYVFYTGLLWLYIIYSSLIKKKLNKKIIIATTLLTTLFLLKDYRLIYAMFIDKGFTSHRVEFDVFFNADLLETYRLMLVKFLQGHTPHAEGLQQLYLIPLSIIALLLSISKRRFSKHESMLIWTLIILSFVLDLWNTLLINRYSMPVITLLAFFVFFRRHRYRLLGATLLIILSLDLIASLFQFQGFKWISDYFPILKSFNMVRLYFIEPMLLAILLTISGYVFLRKLKHAPIFILIFLITQFNFALDQSFYKVRREGNYLTFKEYYAPEVFNKIQKDILKATNTSSIKSFKFISYGIEPAVALYNGFYTVDGYSTNYPLSYKKKFRKTMEKIFDIPIMKSNKVLYDTWGSKLYLMSMDSRAETYQYFAKTTPSPTFFNADMRGICDLGTDFVISSHPLKGIEDSLKLFGSYRGKFWKIWIYKTLCPPPKQ